jgi:hypothetical protein
LGLRLPGQSEEEEALSVQFGWFDAGWFETVRTPLVAGRSFTREEVLRGDSLIVINETLARRLWPGENPIGRRVIFQGNRVVVGVARDGKYRNLREEPMRYAFLPFNPCCNAMLYVRARGDAAVALRALREEVTTLNADVALQRPRLLADDIALLLLPQRIAAGMIGAFGFMDLLLATLGIYGVLSYYVAQRIPDFGICLALGARPNDVIRPVLRQGVRLAAIGGAIGLALATVVTRLASSFLYGVGTKDLVTFIVVPVILGAAALLASYLPARRASRVDPVR